jgi:hypothetical protein
LSGKKGSAAHVEEEQQLAAEANLAILVQKVGEADHATKKARLDAEETFDEA